MGRKSDGRTATKRTVKFLATCHDPRIQRAVLQGASDSVYKSICNAFFIIAENQFNIGDKIQIGKLEGEVNKMTLRLTVLKDKNGNLIYIPNSQIITVVKINKKQT